MTLLYSIWCAVWITVLYLLLFPIQYICLQREAWKPAAHRINSIWGKLFFFGIGMPVRVEYRFRPDRKQAYVFCANHFSYLDIAMMGVVIENYYSFVGKSEVKKIPLLGYMFAKLHIQVTREEAKSRAYSLNKCIRTLAKGRSIVIFPEGGIRAKQPPKMAHPFKDGAFTMAIQQQVPIVPISLLNNYKILPDKKKMRMHHMALRVVVHEPILTQGMTQEDVESLKEQTFRIIDAELMKSEKVASV